MPVAAVMAVTAIASAAASNKASKQSAGAAKNQLASTNRLADRTRTDAQGLYAKSGQSSRAGIGGAMNFYQQNMQKRNAPMVQGNMMAQSVLGQGAQQANNAILGLPVDMSFANVPQQVNADYSGINSAQMPILGVEQVGPTQNANSANIQTPSPKKESRITAGGYLSDPRVALKPMELLKNPLGGLGVGKKFTDKLDPVKKTKKLLGKFS